MQWNELAINVIYRSRAADLLQIDVRQAHHIAVCGCAIDWYPGDIAAWYILLIYSKEPHYGYECPQPSFPLKRISCM